jgi:Aspartyl protease
MKILSLVLTALLLTHSGTAQVYNLNQGGATHNYYYEEIPYEVIKGKIIIPVEINGKSRKFLLDTGAPTQLSKALTIELNPQVLASDIKLIDGYHNEVKSNILMINSLKLGSIEFDSIPALSFMPDFLKCWGVEGIIGSNLIRNAIVQFNAVEKKIILTDDDKKLSPMRDSGTPILANVNPESSPYIVVQLGDHANEEILFDTGEESFYVMTSGAMDRLRHLHVFEILSAGYGSNAFGEAGAEKRADKYRIRVNALRVNGAVFTNVMTESIRNSANNGNRMGSKLLEYGKVTLDYRHAKFHFEPFKDTIDLNEKKWPLSPTIANGQLLVGIVWGAFSKQASPGEQILAIDGTSYETIDPCVIMTSTRLITNDKAVITLKDKKGNVRRLEIMKE